MITGSQSRPWRPARHERGFTLVELVFVVGLAVVLLGVGVGSMKSLILGQRVKSASFDVFSSITYARSEAITRNTTVAVAPVSGNWANGWTVSDAGGTVLRRHDGLTNITVSGPGSVSYSGMGRLSAAVTSFTISGAGLSDADVRCISIDLSGRPVVKAGAC